jgi:hypothetical protein
LKAFKRERLKQQRTETVSTNSGFADNEHLNEEFVKTFTMFALQMLRRIKFFYDFKNEA